ncbi:transketolase family protein [Metabacillus halosaccharovorans]|uniref:transketolase family protein n=1 Tax=Metabacillus halosaccharovorans TaxID=930124 RepID=UPI001C1F7331|nr:transketolase C-terminal domain-containing protein [Metabacillus halosaccharovorans]MBU7595704.1 transketolase family protein [Metabacillus halosaccharovorans]
MYSLDQLASSKDAAIEWFLTRGEFDDSFLTMGSDGSHIFDPFSEKFPERYIDVGIAEQNLFGVAAGIARTEKTVFVSAIASFLLRRAYEQIRIDICNENLPVKIIGMGAGLSYGDLGSTHHLIEDISLCSGMPNIAIFTPVDATEIGDVLEEALKWKGPAYIRLGSGLEPVIRGTSRFKFKEPDIIFDEQDIMILATGICVSEAIKAKNTLEKKGLLVGVINISSIEPINKEQILNLILNKKLVIVVEEHSVRGGLGSIIADLLSSQKNSCILSLMGIDKRKAPPLGRDKLLDFYNLTSDHIVEEIIRKKDVIY